MLLTENIVYVLRNVTRFRNKNFDFLAKSRSCVEMCSAVLTERDGAADWAWTRGAQGTM